jgi:integrase
VVVDAGGTKRWVFLFMRDGRQREMGLGSILSIGLAAARERAAECRALLAAGKDPIDVRRAARKAGKGHRTFGQCADMLIAAKRSEWRSAKHAEQWRSSLDRPCRAIREKPIDELDTAAVLSVLKPLWVRTPETARRLRGRIEAVIDYGKAHGWRSSSENPARWRGHLDHLLARRPNLARAHHAAMDYHVLPAFVAKLRTLNSAAAQALTLLIYTGARLGEVRGLTWDEVDFDAKVWVIPAVRMKSGREHRVPLAPAAFAILIDAKKFSTGNFIFPGRSGKRPVTGQPVRNLVPPGATVHGFRSSFRDWCGEETVFPRELAEGALAHVTGDETERSYRRLDALERRRELMTAWEKFLVTPVDN